VRSPSESGPGPGYRAWTDGLPGCLGRNTNVNRCLAEGRKSFLERYAGIESGRECERLASALPAFVDGEADAVQAVDLRVHLRQCLACRAAVRGLHDASRPLTVVFPASGLVVASGGAEQAHGLFVRVYETVSLYMHERTANSFQRAQAIVDTVTAGKMAAAAAALAGGGVAVEGVLSAAPATPAAMVRRVDNGASTAFVKSPVPRTKTHAHAKQRSHARTSKTSGAGGSRRASSGSRGSTGSGNAAAASRVSSAPAASTPRVTAASTGATRGAGTSATSEFGFEGP
jgi:hypothetical protein